MLLLNEIRFANYSASLLIGHLTSDKHEVYLVCFLIRAMLTPCLFDVFRSWIGCRRATEHLQHFVQVQKAIRVKHCYLYL